jgi:predicted MPP superfamily phosphohydrolase
LILTGHAHGGQWRIPGILEGVFSPDQGIFPQYTNGVYTTDKTTMLVSRGLSRESTSIPRFNNPPEIVVIDLVPEQ